MVMASTRVWLLAVVLTCILLVKSTDADGSPSLVSGAGIFGCNPLTDKTCRPGDPRSLENQEEEGGFGVRMPSMPGSGGDGGDDDELPSFNTHLTILGH